jgi:urease accessory protein
MPDNWLIWQLADAAFPAGGFAHSGGVEAVARWGLVPDGRRFEQLIYDQLTQATQSMIPLLTAVQGDPQEFVRADRLCNALLSNHVANRASRSQGKALLIAVQAAFDQTALRDLAEKIRRDATAGHLAPVFGAVCHALELSRGVAVRLFLHLTMRGLISSGVRLGIVGPLEGQSIQHRLGSRAEDLAERGERLESCSVAQTAPLIDLLQATHDRLYSRLFQS